MLAGATRPGSILLLFLGALFVGGSLISIAWWHTQNIEKETLIRAAESYSNAVSAFRNFYSTEVLSRLEGSGVKVTHRYRDYPHAIPIPATMTIELAKQINSSEREISIDVISPYPFPWRQQRPLSSFAQNALRELSGSTLSFYHNVVEENGKRRLYYASPMRMTEACVTCHNHHPETPKTGWKIGDVRGLQVISMPIGEISAENRLGLSYLTGFIILSFIGAFSVILWFANRDQLAYAELRYKTRRLEETLKELASFKKALDQHAIVSIADAQGNITYANERFCKISGYRIRDLIGKNHRLVRSGVHPPEFMRAMWREIASGQVWHGEICNRAANGDIYWVASTIVPFVDDKGRPQQYISIRTDITERKRMEEEAERSRRFIEGVTDAIGEGVFATNEDGLCLFINPEAERILGWDADSLQGSEILNQIYLSQPESHSQSERDSPMIESIGRGEVFRSDKVRFRRRDGTGFPVQVVIVPMRTGTEIIGWVTVFQDITERKQAEMALRESEERFRQVASAAQEAIITIDEAGEVVFWNHGAEMAFGYSEREIIGSSLTKIMPPELRAGHSIGLEHAKNRGELKHQGEALELPAIRKDGRKITIEIAISTWLSAGNRFFTAIGRDITEKKTILQELAQAKEVAEQANMAKSDFLANMSHEIRTPMNAVIGLSHLALEKSRDSRQRDYLTKISIAARNLLGIINDILDFSKIEAGKMSVETIPFSLSEVLSQIKTVISAKVEEKGLKLKISATAATPDRLCGDPLRLNQILINLVNNGVKFTDKGGVTVTVSAVAPEQVSREVRQFRSEADVIYLRFVVEDSGIGLSQEQQQRLFHSFSQADTSTTRKYGGTGLGLAICRRLVMLMGGEIKVASVVGEGSRFSFDLPLLADHSPREEKRAEAKITARDRLPGRDVELIQGILGARVLLVEDNAINQQVAIELLERIGLTVIAVTDGKRALAAVKEADPLFDLVLMDIQMPEMDGYEASRQIRAAGFEQLPIIALTAHALSGDDQKSLAAGMNDHLTKPIDPDHLFAAMTRWIEPKKRVSALQSPPSTEEEVAIMLPPSLPGIDVDAGVKLVRGNRKLYRKLLIRFALEQAEMAQQMRSALEHDLEEAIKLSHSIKGSAATIGARELAAEAATLEQLLRQGEPVSTSQEKHFYSVLEEVLSAVGSLPQESGAVDGNLTVDRGQVETILDKLTPLLHNGDLQGIDLSHELSAALKGSALASTAEALVNAVEGFEFERADALQNKIRSEIDISL
ncbi:MAG: PAS domain S-box protein [Gammaproteobacteria bacterium]|nr:PAS domain S-box protein [Gammaproteobacteria bacterium]